MEIKLSKTVMSLTDRRFESGLLIDSNNFILNVNVAGTLFVTTRDTLNKIEYFRMLFDNKFRTILDKDGNIFLDRNPELFNIILNSVRSGDFDTILEISDQKRLREIQRESKFYGIREIYDPFEFNCDFDSYSDFD